MGVVLVARDEKFRGKRIALKIARTSSEECKKRFAREAYVGDLLGKEKGFVRAFDWGELDASTLYLGMDLVEGAKPLELTGELAGRLARLRDAARLVALAHEKGVVHRDLKPANFLQGKNGAIWLTDFGLAKVVGESDEDSERTGGLTLSNVAMGTPSFMSPEQFSDSKRVDARTDVYALGVMLFVALTGRLPFSGKPLEVMAKQVQVTMGAQPMPQARVLVADVPAALDALCTRAIALSVEQRLSKAVGLVEGLDAFLAASTVPPPVSSPYTPTVREVASPSPVRPVVATGWLGESLPAELRRASQAPVLLWNTGKGLEIEMVHVPPGEFIMGDDERNPKKHRHAMPHGFWIARKETTWREYLAFCTATRRPRPDRPEWASTDEHPVVNVTWDDAQAFCEWAGLALPTEAEWEKAARGTDGRTYPWGNEEPTADRCIWEGHPTYGGRSTAPVGSCPKGASPFGALDMAGNVHEWCADEYELKVKVYERHSYRVYRGGSWESLDEWCWSSDRKRCAPWGSSIEIGFRVLMRSYS